MFAIAIKDLEMHFGNLNLLLKKSAIWFEPLARKKETNKQMISIIYYQY